MPTPGLSVHRSTLRARSIQDRGGMGSPLENSIAKGPWQRRSHNVKCVARIATMACQVCQVLDERLEVEGRTAPAMCQNTWNGGWANPNCVKEVSGIALNVCYETGQLIKTRFLRTPIEFLTPIIHQRAHEWQAYAVLRIDLKNSSRKPGIL